MLNRRQFMTLMSAAAAAASPKIRAQGKQLPNILFILADDLGYGDPSCFGQKKFTTPNIDLLAAEGIRFTDAYTGAAVCAPSRCSLMTGKNTGHARIRANKSKNGQRISLQPDDVTVAEVLKQAGYHTGIIGKWGIGEAGSWGVPNDKGFDEFLGFLNQDDALHYYPQIIWDNTEQYNPPGNQGDEHKDYAQKMFTNRAMSFIKRNQTHPFFLYLPYTIPHPDSELGRQTGNGYVVPSYGEYASKDWPDPEKGYVEMIRLLDDDIGTLMALLKKLGIDTNTLVIFASDNGSGVEGGHDPKFFDSNGGLRGVKAELYEGGIRTPSIARWTGRIRPGQVCSAPWAFCDFLPTAADLTGMPIPAGTDGQSIVPMLFDQGSAPPRKPLYWEGYDKGFSQAVRFGPWKALRKGSLDGPVELYNLEHDPNERDNIAASHSEQVVEAARIMAANHAESPDYSIKSTKRAPAA
jgi:arylsulfatase A-like enzyme